MKCPNCEQENKDIAQKCKKCGLDLTIPPLWKPTLKWHLKTLAIIYIILGVIYFLLRIFLG